jgi:chromosome segregation ATPase
MRYIVNALNAFLLLACGLSLLAAQLFAQSDCASQLARMTELVNKSNKEIESLRKELDGRERSNKTLNRNISQKDQFIDSLSGELAQKKVEVVSLTSSLNARKVELTQRDSTLAQRNTDNASLRANMEAKQQDINQKSEQIRGLQNDIELKKQELVAKDQQIAALRTDLDAQRTAAAEKDKLLTSLTKSALVEMKKQIEDLRHETDELRRQIQDRELKDAAKESLNKAERGEVKPDVKSDAKKKQ